MKQTKLDFYGFKHTINSPEQKNDKPHLSDKEKRSWKKHPWNNIKMMQFNIESAGTERVRQVIAGMEKEGIHIAFLQGTRSNYDFDSSIQGTDFKIFVQACGMHDHEKYAGTGIIIHNSLIHKMRVVKNAIIPARGMVLRIRDEMIDISLIAAYAPGDHLPRDKRRSFWKNLKVQIRNLPTRTTILMGIDANGQIGRDGSAAVGGGLQGRWTENGAALDDLLDSTRLNALSCLASCTVDKSKNWSWMRRDGVAKTLIDFLVASRQLVGKILTNPGPCSLIDILPQGASIDHRPVVASLAIKPLPELMKGNTKDKKNRHDMCSNFNHDLVQAHSAYQTHLDNQFRQHHQPVDEVSFQRAVQFQNEVKNAIKWDAEMSVEEIWENINGAVTGACKAVFENKEPNSAKLHTKKKEWISETTFSLIQQQKNAWHEVKTAGSGLGEGWETKLHKYFIDCKASPDKPSETILAEHFQGTPHPNMSSTIKLWINWDEIRRKARQGVRKDKHDFLMGTVEEGIGVDKRLYKYLEDGKQTRLPCKRDNGVLKG